MNEGQTTKHPRRQDKKVTIRVDTTKGTSLPRGDEGKRFKRLVEVRRASDHKKWETLISKRVMLSR